MTGTGIIDQFLETFTRYIDNGFGLLGGDVGYLAITLAAIDITLAALFWSWGPDEDIIARLVKKTLFVGVFAYLISSWNSAGAHRLRKLCGPWAESVRREPIRVRFLATGKDRSSRA
jgi:type IV secretory pathway TrbL component